LRPECRRLPLSSKYANENQPNYPAARSGRLAVKRVTGSHRHFTHPEKPGLVTVAGKPSATLKPKTEASILKQALLGKGER
jgi:predicted RNA binding protein YcfA (HicA-like mRNA interferase family)